MKEFGIYVHIPFCKSKCHYCDFISYSGKETIWEKYVEALKEEIKYNSSKLKDKNITTIYIGGGTPSIISSSDLTEILNEIKQDYKIDQNCEITIEVNPGTANEEKLSEYKKAGINRLSIGLQSTNNEILKKIGRIHTYEQFLDTYNTARKVGFSNINVDLMLALPNQSLGDLEKSLKEVIELNPEHISVYSLIVEEGTKLEQMIDEKEVQLLDDEQERQMYWEVKEMLEQNDYIHYEISNFAKKGYESKHNVNCWNQEEYIGFGVAAHSYIDNKRFSNIESVEQYIDNITNKNIEKNVMLQEIQNDEMKKKEYMMLGLRKLEGVSIQEFKNKFTDNPIYLFRNELEELVNDDLIEIDLDRIKLTNKGLDLANTVWVKFI